MKFFCVHGPPVGVGPFDLAKVLFKSRYRTFRPAFRTTTQPAVDSSISSGQNSIGLSPVLGDLDGIGFNVGTGLGVGIGSGAGSGRTPAARP